MMRNTSFFTVAFLSLIYTLAADYWQGYGNMSASNLTVIWGYINANITNAVITTSLGGFSVGLSDHLNQLWSPAWNVVTVSCSSSIPKDTVLYGYAFRDHWMWYNTLNINNVAVSFIIWKDYNCQQWVTVTSTSQTFPDADSAKITSVAQNAKNQLTSLDDIWKAAKITMDNLLKASPFNQPGSAFSIVASQGSPITTSFFSRICAANGNYYYKAFDSFQGNGRILLFQTR